MCEMTIVNENMAKPRYRLFIRIHIRIRNVDENIRTVNALSNRSVLSRRTEKREMLRNKIHNLFLSYCEPNLVSSRLFHDVPAATSI